MIDYLMIADDASLGDYFMIPENAGEVNLECPSGEDVLFYMYEAYKQCYFSDIAPGLFEFYENLMDELHFSSRKTFSFRGMPLVRAELNNPYFVELLLKEYRFQFMGQNDFEIGDCQNILVWEMVEDERRR